MAKLQELKKHLRSGKVYRREDLADGRRLSIGIFSSCGQKDT
ncbi:hypothetical protein [Agrobacterium fabrum]|nr:hypothetical protein [Agrobacterium fabrum]AYM60910.1 hypothetical protein At1D132_49030 [Agrobacterium fabrum]